MSENEITAEIARPRIPSPRGNCAPVWLRCGQAVRLLQGETGPVGRRGLADCPTLWREQRGKRGRNSRGSAEAGGWKALLISGGNIAPIHFRSRNPNWRRSSALFALLAFSSWKSDRGRAPKVFDRCQARRTSLASRALVQDVSPGAIWLPFDAARSRAVARLAVLLLNQIRKFEQSVEVNEPAP